MSFLSLRSAKGATETRMDADFARESDTRAVASSFAGTGLLGRCANSGCRSGWIHLFRKRSIPMFEDGWTCSPECTEAMLRGALHREMSGRQPAREIHHHRIPLGLLMMEQGWITGKQLRDWLYQPARGPAAGERAMRPHRLC